MSASALLVAMDTLTLRGRHIPVGVDYPDSYHLTGPLPGFYVWLASLAVPAIGAVVTRLRYTATARAKRTPAPARTS